MVAHAFPIEAGCTAPALLAFLAHSVSVEWRLRTPAVVLPVRMAVSALAFQLDSGTVLLVVYINLS